MSYASPSPDSWPRALGVGLAAVVLLVLGFFYAPQFILVQMSAPARGVRVWMAAAWMGLAFIVACRAAWRMTRPSRP